VRRRPWAAGAGVAAALLIGIALLWVFGGDRFAFSPDASLLASAGSDHTVHVWDVETADVITVLRDHTDHVIGVNFSADGRWLATTAAFQDGTVRIWDCDSWTQTCRAQSPHRTNAMYVAFSPDSRSVVTSGYRGGVRVYDFDGARLDLRFERHHDDGEMVPHVAFSRSGDSFATSSWDRTLRLWDLATGDELWSAGVPEYARCFEASAFSPDGATIYCVTRDETIQARAAANGKLKSSFRWQDEARGLDLSSDGQLLVTAGHRGQIKLWHVSDLLASK